MKKVELLAPAGNYEAFLGAINAGADAVYLGGEKYGARAYADNFTEEEIINKFLDKSDANIICLWLFKIAYVFLLNVIKL